MDTTWHVRTWVRVVGCMLLGALIVLAVRFVVYTPDRVHYHANFAVYINGLRESFNDPQYYEEVAACKAGTNITPADRAHMHDKVNDVVHVHDHAVTWGQFFDNLGWYIGPDFIEKPDGTMYISSGQSRLHLMINGQDYTDLTAITNMLIKDKSRVLISYGDIDTTTLNQEYRTIATTAAKYDTGHDPKSCSGGDGVSLGDRLSHLF